MRRVALYLLLAVATASVQAGAAAVSLPEVPGPELLAEAFGSAPVRVAVAPRESSDSRGTEAEECVCSVQREISLLAGSGQCIPGWGLDVARS